MNINTISNVVSINSYKPAPQRNYNGAAIINDNGQEIAITDEMIESLLNQMIEMADNTTSSFETPSSQHFAS